MQLKKLLKYLFQILYLIIMIINKENKYYQMQFIMVIIYIQKNEKFILFFTI